MASERKEQMDAIADAIETLINKPSLKRLDGDGWKAYRVVDVIRVDVDIPTKEDK